ncbi:MAG: TraR/DksA family transcriptional regulator [Streptosporangiales bacterium]
MVDTDNQRARLRELLADLDHTLGTLRDTDAETGDPRQNETDASDSGAHLSDSDRSAAVVEAAEEQRRHVLAALQRIDDGTYGSCVDCATQVPDGRLDARPEADRCVTCQQRVDAA